jgi:predicted O-methyltransferase YrrM
MGSLYSSTRTVLERAGDRLVPGSVVVFDDLLGYPGYEQHELRAFEEFVSERKVEWELIGACLLGREVAIRITRT